MLAFDPVARGAPPVRIIDRDCEDLESAAERLRHARAVHPARVVRPEERLGAVGRGASRRPPSAWTAAGRVLFIHARTPWPVHELVNALLALPIDLRQAMYVEGGPEAQLFVRGGGREHEWVGGFEHVPQAENRDAWPVPNVVAAVPRR